jgi:hypothetical protein
MSQEEITLENLTASQLASFGNANCIGCTQLRGFAQEIIDILPTEEETRLGYIIGRFAGFAAFCPRLNPVPAPNFTSNQKSGAACSVLPKERKCKFSELMNMTAEERAEKVREIAGS